MKRKYYGKGYSKNKYLGNSEWKYLIRAVFGGAAFGLLYLLTGSFLLSVGIIAGAIFLYYWQKDRYFTFKDRNGKINLANFLSKKNNRNRSYRRVK